MRKPTSPLHSSIRTTWERLPTPPKGARATGARVGTSNAWVTRSPEDRFGLLLTGVERPLGDPLLKNIHIRYAEELELERGGRCQPVTRCLETVLDPPFDPEILIVILERLWDKRPSGEFTTAALLVVLKEVRELVEALPPGPSKEQVVGVWGELYLLSRLLGIEKDPEVQADTISAWESAVRARDILDFRFSRARIVLEAKTSLGSRVHHLQGFGQVTVPDGFTEGYLASLIVSEPLDITGRSCADLVRTIKESLKGNSADRRRLESLFLSKLKGRGSECLDSRYRFETDLDSLAFYSFDSVPRPLPARQVSRVEWCSDLAEVAPLPNTGVDKLLKVITNRRISSGPRSGKQ